METALRTALLDHLRADAALMAAISSSAWKVTTPCALRSAMACKMGVAGVMG